MHVNDSNILILNTFGVGLCVPVLHIIAQRICLFALEVRCLSNQTQVLTNSVVLQLGRLVGLESSARTLSPAVFRALGERRHQAEDLAQSGEEEGVNVIKVMP